MRHKLNLKSFVFFLRDRGFLLALSILFNFPAMAFHRDADPPKSKEPQNVVFILTDDHWYDYMGFTGKVPLPETTNMDRLASEGTYLPNAFVTRSLCLSSGASILTGQCRHAHTIVDNQASEPGNRSLNFKFDDEWSDIPPEVDTPYIRLHAYIVYLRNQLMFAEARTYAALLGHQEINMYNL